MKWFNNIRCRPPRSYHEPFGRYRFLCRGLDLSYARPLAAIQRPRSNQRGHPTKALHQAGFSPRPILSSGAIPRDLRSQPHQRMVRGHRCRRKYSGERMDTVDRYILSCTCCSLGMIERHRPGITGEECQCQLKRLFASEIDSENALSTKYSLGYRGCETHDDFSMTRD
ncbi:hypothetical protein DFH06DRAFT_1472278, partial [Mycena polygramma]